jgi:flagellar hook-basal body complex protein FliE
MPVPPLSATGAYSSISRLGLRSDAASAAGPQSTATTGSGSFAGMVRDVANQTIGSMHDAEQASVRAVSGQGGDLNSVVMAVSNAEVTLQTAVAVRDKVIQAYMDIVRMPI